MGTSPTIRANDSVPSAMANASCFISLLFFVFRPLSALSSRRDSNPLQTSYLDATGCPDSF